MSKILRKTFLARDGPLNSLIDNVAVLFDSITSMSIIILFVIVFKFRRQIKFANNFTIFLFFYAGVYLVIIGILPLVHFRYLIPLWQKGTARRRTIVRRLT